MNLDFEPYKIVKKEVEDKIYVNENIYIDLDELEDALHDIRLAGKYVKLKHILSEVFIYVDDPYNMRADK